MNSTTEAEIQESKPYSPIATILITVGIYFASQLIAALTISIVPLLRRWSVAETTAWLENNVWATFIFVCLVEAATLWLLYLFLKHRKLGFRYLGLNKPAAKYIAYALLGFAAYFVLYILGLIVAKAAVPTLDLEQKQELGFSTAARGVALVPIFISLVILPPVVEEIVARGFLYGGLRTKLPVFAAASITSVLFAAAHLGEASDGLLWVAAIDTFILSMVLCYLREKTASLWPSMGLHMLKNGLAFVILFNISSYFR